MNTQSTVKHTAGEWFRMDRRYSGDKRARMEICTFRDDGTPDQRIATVHDCTINPAEEHTEEVQANARLIAAAPELLEALKDAADMLRLMGIDMNGHEMTRNIQATISKATGGAS